MSETQSPNAQSSKILMAAGIFCTLFGLFMFNLRQGFAGFFFNAHFFFGVPIAGSDAFKLFIITMGSFITTIMGLVVFGAGLFFFLKSSAQQTTSAPTHR